MLSLSSMLGLGPAVRSRVSGARAVALVALAGVAACAAPQAIELDEQAAATTSAELAAGGRICSWNIRRLGHAFDSLPKDIPATAKVIEDNCDVIAVQEVMQTSGGVTPGYDDLSKELGSTWDGDRTDRPAPDTTSANSEHYAFHWRKTSAKRCNNWTGVKQLSDGPDTFIREPAWTCLRLKGQTKDLVLVNYHAMYGSVAERRREVTALDDDLNNDGTKDDLVRAIKASRSGLPLIVIAGDFNLDHAAIAEELPDFRDLTTGNGSTINASDDITENLFDHFLIPPNQPRLDHLEPAEVLDVRDAAATGAKYYQTISDHLPIRFVLTPPPSN